MGTVHTHPFPGDDLTNQANVFILIWNICSLCHACLILQRQRGDLAMTPAYFQELYDFNDWNNSSRPNADSHSPL